MNVTIYGCRYKVWDTDDPHHHRYIVSKGKRCSCGLVKCEHVKAVFDYLKKGGKRAPEEPYDPRPTLEQRIQRIRALRERCVQENTLSEATKALILAQKVSSEFERVAWMTLYALPQQMPENV